MPIIESVTGGRNIEPMLQVDGVELFFFGPADYSSSAGYRGQWEGPGVAEQLLAIKDAIRAAGKHCGVIATSNENLRERWSRGFGCWGWGSMRVAAAQPAWALAEAGRDRTIVPALSPERDSPAATSTTVYGNA